MNTNVNEVARGKSKTMTNMFTIMTTRNKLVITTGSELSAGTTDQKPPMDRITAARVLTIKVGYKKTNFG